MINLEECLKLFKDYVASYDMSDEKIYLKYYHTLRVVDFCKEIAISLNLNEEDIKISMVLGLLHDIGRFEQIRIYNTFSDKDSIDHADYGVKILKENNLIQKFVSNSDIQHIVLIAIHNHNKFTIENDLDDKIQMFCKIIRDADKLDIFNIFIETKLKIAHTDSFISEKILNDLLNHKCIKDSDLQTEMDNCLRTLGMFFDINFAYSSNYIKNNNIVDKLVDEIIKSNEHEKENLNRIRKSIYKFLEEK